MLASQQKASNVDQKCNAVEALCGSKKLRVTLPRMSGSSDLHVPQCQHESAHFGAVIMSPQRSGGCGEMDARQ